MGKKRKQLQNYDEHAFTLFINTMLSMRQAVEGGGIPELQIDREKLEEVIKSRLAKNDRESIEKYFGLVPGTICHASRKKKDPACLKMRKDAELATRKLYDIEQLLEFDGNMREMTEEILKKVDKRNLKEIISDLDILKYLKIFFIIICGGPNWYWEDEKINTEYEDRCQVDDISIFSDMRATFKELGENEFDFKLLIDTLAMFDCRDLDSMKECVGLPIGRERNKSFQDLPKFMSDVRSLKERLFPFGEWTVTVNLMVYIKHEHEEFPKFFEAMEEICRDWEKLNNYLSPNTQKVIDSKGKREVATYEIGELSFSDIEEVVSVYVNYLSNI